MRARENNASLEGVLPEEVFGAGDGIRARDLWTWALGHLCSPDYESGALARLGYPGITVSVKTTKEAQNKGIDNNIDNKIDNAMRKSKLSSACKHLYVKLF
jgi:hypothetical protein